MLETTPISPTKKATTPDGVFNRLEDDDYFDHLNTTSSVVIGWRIHAVAIISPPSSLSQLFSSKRLFPFVRKRIHSLIRFSAVYTYANLNIDFFIQSASTESKYKSRSPFAYEQLGRGLNVNDDWCCLFFNTGCSHWLTLIIVPGSSQSLSSTSEVTKVNWKFSVYNAAQ